MDLTSILITCLLFFFSFFKILVIKTHRTENNIKNHWNCSLKKRLEPSNSFSDVIYGSRPYEPKNYISFQIMEAAKSPQRDSLELTLGPMNLGNMPSSTSSLGGEESISSSVESDRPKLNGNVEISHWTPFTI